MRLSDAVIRAAPTKENAINSQCVTDNFKTGSLRLFMNVYL